MDRLIPYIYGECGRIIPRRTAREIPPAPARNPIDSFNEGMIEGAERSEIWGRLVPRAIKKGGSFGRYYRSGGIERLDLVGRAVFCIRCESQVLHTHNHWRVRKLCFSLMGRPVAISYGLEPLAHRSRRFLRGSAMSVDPLPHAISPD